MIIIMVVVMIRIYLPRACVSLLLYYAEIIMRCV